MKHFVDRLIKPFLVFSLQINSKYSDELAAECLEWIKEVTGEPINTSGDMDNFFEVLKDGVILCKLVNALQPATIKKVNESKMAFKCMENISAFLEHAKAFGVPVQETFQSGKKRNLLRKTLLSLFCLQLICGSVRIWTQLSFACNRWGEKWEYQIIYRGGIFKTFQF